MKRYLLLIPITLMPYALLFSLYCVFIDHYIIENLFCSNGLLLLLALLIFVLIAFVCTLIFTVVSINKENNSRRLAFANMLIKIIHMPAYIVIFVLGVLFFMTIFTFAFSIFFVLFDLAAIFMTGLIGLAANSVEHRKGETGKVFAVINSILQFVYFADVVSAIMVFTRSRKQIKL